MNLREQVDGRFRPHAPVAEQAAPEAHRCLAPAPCGCASGVTQVGDDVVVVAGVEGDALLGAGRHHAECHVERLVAVERGDLDGDHVLEAAKRVQKLRESGMPPTAVCR